MEWPHFERFASPHALTLALPLVALALVGAFVARWRFRPHLWFLPGLVRGALFTALLFLIAAPLAVDRLTTPGRLEILIDVSRSIPGAALEKAVDDCRLAVDEARKVEPETEVLVLAFGGKALRLHDGKAKDMPSRDELLARVRRAPEDGADPWTSDLAQALLVGATGANEPRAVERRIYTDGAVTLPDEAFPKLSGRTVIVLPDADQTPNLRALRLLGPSELEADVGLKLTLEAISSTARPATLELFVDGKAAAKQELTLLAGLNEIALGGDDLKIPPGDHEILAAFSSGDAETADDAAGLGIFVAPKKRALLLLASDGDLEHAAALERALAVQGVILERSLATVASARDLAGDELTAVVLDRVPPAELSSETTTALLAAVNSGAGLIVFPRQDDGEMLRWNEHPLAAILPLEGRVVPKAPEAAPEKNPADDAPKGEKLEDPDIDKSKVEKIDAPTLTMLLVIDKSSSMQEEGRIDQAKRGAIATARELHPEDRIGVVTFADEPVEAVPVQPAANIAEIERAVQRIRVAGGTDIKKALNFAQDVLSRETSAVRVVVLLSDGYSIRFNAEKTAKAMADQGISITTVGIGETFDYALLSQLAVAGRGTGPIPARSSGEIPKVMVDVASSVMQKNKTRTAKDVKKPKERDPSIKRPENLLPDEKPKPKADVAGAKTATNDLGTTALAIKAARAVSYLDGLDLDDGPKLFGVHPTKARPGAWVSLATERNDAVLAHDRFGDGLVALFGVPPEKGWSRDLGLWERYPVFLAQLYRFIERGAARPRLEIEGAADRSSALVAVFDRRAREDDPSFTFRIVGPDGPAAATTHALGASRYLVSWQDPKVGPFVRLNVEKDGRKVGGTSFFVPPPEEIRRRGVDLERAEIWRSRLGGEIARAEAPRRVPEAKAVETHRPVGGKAALLVLLVFGLDLATKRLLLRTENA